MRPLLLVALLAGIAHADDPKIACTRGDSPRTAALTRR
jgi:hypothetical protein